MYLPGLAFIMTLTICLNTLIYINLKYRCLFQNGLTDIDERPGDRLKSGIAYSSIYPKKEWFTITWDENNEGT